MGVSVSDRWHFIDERGRWQVTGDMWEVTGYRGHVTVDTWQVTCDKVVPLGKVFNKEKSFDEKISKLKKSYKNIFWMCNNNLVNNIRYYCKKTLKYV